MEPADLLQSGPWTLHRSPCLRAREPGRHEARLFHADLQPPVLDLVGGAFVVGAARFVAGEALELELGAVAAGGLVPYRIDLARGEWSTPADRGPHPLSRLQERCGAPGAQVAPWPVAPAPTPPPPVPAPAVQPTSAPAPAVAPAEALSVDSLATRTLDELLAALAAAGVGSSPPALVVSVARSLVAGEWTVGRAAQILQHHARAVPAPPKIGPVQSEVRTHDGRWRFVLTPTEVWEREVRGAFRPHYHARLVRAADGVVCVDTATSGHLVWVGDGELQLRRAAGDSQWLAVSLVRATFWYDCWREPMSAEMPLEQLAAALGPG